MEMRFLGGSGLQVSCLGFGAMTFGGGGVFSRIGEVQLDEARSQVDLCLEAGVNLFDTADIYANGLSEEILGATLRGERRQRALIATKAFHSTGTGPHDKGLSRHHLVAACEASLKRLGTDWIDLYQVHNFDALVPLEETLRALDDLVQAGKVRHIGCSNHAGWQLMKALAVADRLGTARYIGQQIQYSLLVRDAEHELMPLGVDQAVGALVWSPLAQGYLSGKFRDGSADAARLVATRQLRHVDTERGRRVLATLDAVAAEHPGRSPSQVALAWLLRKPGVGSVLVGARNREQLRDNLGAAHLSLSDAQMAALDDASAQPLPYPQAHQRSHGEGRIPALPAHVPRAP